MEYVLHKRDFSDKNLKSIDQLGGRRQKGKS